MNDPDRQPGPDADDSRPWERSGFVRRDCAPHRANVLMLLATVAVVLGLSSFCLVFTGWLGFILGGVVRHLADCDLAKMRAGVMDPNGRRQTEAAREQALWGMFYGGFGGLVCGVPLLVGLAHLFR
jgi:hypothetical protein